MDGSFKLVDSGTNIAKWGELQGGTPSPDLKPTYEFKVSTQNGKPAVSLYTDNGNHHISGGALGRRISAGYNEKGTLVVEARSTGGCFPGLDRTPRESDVKDLREAIAKELKTATGDVAKGLKQLDADLAAYRVPPPDQPKWNPNLGNTHGGEANALDGKFDPMMDAIRRAERLIR
jgi:hypothetical protein